MVALKGKPDIGDQINKKIIAPLASANKLSDFPDFNDAAKRGVHTDILHLRARVVVTAAAVSRRRTARNVLEWLSGVNEPPMIIFMTTTGRA
jgi:hypothetical protein